MDEAVRVAPSEQGAVQERAAYLPFEKSRRAGIALCLSGGGYRATLFHLGSLRRLNELGLLTRADFRTVASVSGGSIAAAGLAAGLVRMGTLPSSGPLPEDSWDREVHEPVRRFTRRNIRTPALARRLLPWNWLRSSTGVETLAEQYEAHLTDLRLVALPLRPNFVLCATDMSYGVNWVYERGRMGDYMAGYRKPPADTFPLARAVAASSCFPPVFNPLPAAVGPEELRDGRARPGPERRDAIARLRLTDGGDYDNMGLEPVWKDHAVVLVSDAGGLFTNEGDRGLLWRIPRYQGIQERQARGLRKRWLIASFLRGELDGAYWSVGGSRAGYGFPDGYSQELAESVIVEIRTDLDAFSEAEAAVLENHGYLMADAALRRHAPSLLPDPVPTPRVPHPELMDEPRVRKALEASGRRTLLGRWRP